MEARALKILGDLLPVQSRGIRECHALDLASSLDEEGREAGERMLLEYLPDVWKELLELEEDLFNRRDRFGVNNIMDEEECRKIIVTPRSHIEKGKEFLVQALKRTISHCGTQGRLSGPSTREEVQAALKTQDCYSHCPPDLEAQGRKRPKEVGIEPDVGIPYEWELLEEVVAKACSLARERLEVERERCRAEALREEAERAILELRSILDATRAELDEARDDVEGVSLAKQDLKRALVEALTEAGDLRLAEASLRQLSNQVDHAREEASRLSSELDALRVERDEVVGRVAATREEALYFSSKLVALRSEADAYRVRDADPGTDEESSRAGLEAARGEVSALQEWVVVLCSKELELLAEFETMRAEVARLWTELETLRAEHLQVGVMLYPRD
ncbi:hypothetical protein ACLOJK_018752 [Asimina triloba]